MKDKMVAEVSIIVPVYNAEKYLDRCIQSILSQTFSDIEIVIINDGSTDKSKSIIMQYAQKDRRITFIDKENEGVSVARNIGIEHAKGSFITFCDSDDFVASEWIESLYQVIIEHMDCLVNCEYYIYDSERSNSKRKSLGNLKESKLIPKSEYYFYYHNSYSHSCCMRIYCAQIIKSNHIYFDPRISVGEDVLFNIEYLKYCNCFYHISKPLYFVNNDNSSSLSRTPNPKKYDMLKSLYYPRLGVIAEKDAQIFIDEYFYRFYQCLCKIPNYGTKSWQVKYGNHILRDEAFIHALNYSSDYVCGKKLKAILNLKNYRFYLAFMFLVNLKKRLKIKEIFTRFTKRDINE